MSRTERRAKLTEIAEREKLLTSFPPQTVTALLEFAAYIAELDVDYLVFMARKAVRLYDLLIAAGCRRPRGIVITDHVLDQSLLSLVGKRVALIDDTLILGSTLAEAERKLRGRGVSEITTVVFALDHENWQRELCIPERYFISYAQAEMLTFCAEEVEAFSLAGMPYLTDFPVTEQVRLRRSQLSSIYALPGWDAFSLTSQRQESRKVFYYTHIPTEDYLSGISARLGALSDILDITKVRTFVNTRERFHFVRVIPIITLRPLAQDRISHLFISLVTEISDLTVDSREAIFRHLTEPSAKLRFIEYFLSLVLGGRYLSDLVDAAELKRPASFDIEETVRLFGPWLRTPMEAVHRAAARIVAAPDLAVAAIEAAQADPLPSEVGEAAESDYDLFFGEESHLKPNRDVRDRFSDLVRIFVQLHKQYELPARAEAKRLGRKILGATPEQAPHISRLKMGFTWSSLAQFVAKREGIELNPVRSMLLSLMLDALIDLGIAVPILAERNGILFRAYRHGENAPFAEQEYELAYRVAEGFLQGNGRASIPRLTMEKLLVALMRVGVAKRFLNPEYGLNGSEQIARIGFHRHGAIVTIDEEASIFADSQDSWLSSHLVTVGVLSRTRDGHYQLGSEPEAGFISPTAPSEARQLGWLFGNLTRRPGSGVRPILDEDGLSVLTSCCQPKDAAGAALAELRIFNRWFQAEERNLRRFDPSRSNPEDARKFLVRGAGYSAMNSARLKLSGHWAGKPLALVELGTDYLSQLPNGEFAAEHWKASWAQVLAGATADQDNQFSPWIASLGREFLLIATGMFTMELALASLRRSGEMQEDASYQKICAKVLSYFEALGNSHPLEGTEAVAMDRLLARAGAGEMLPDPSRAYVFGLKFIAGRRHVARAVAFELADLVRNYGRWERRTDYNQVIWYDIVNSTGEKGGLQGRELVEHRERVRSFKAAANRLLFGLKRDAQRQGAEITLHPGSLSSTDDEKNVFFAGVRSISRVKDTIELLLKSARAANIGLRMLVINGNFAGPPPHSYEGDPNVEGSAFWEYGSRVKKQLKEIEARMVTEGGTDPACSFVWLGGRFTETPEHFSVIEWQGQASNEEAEVTIDDRPLRVPIFGGLARSVT